jgi:bifunctional DNA-binding transcriptional regulator/antitoxin component of YhaV-PrlF toxin-antitoxin module
METVTLGNQGQLVLPKTIQAIHQWVEGTQFFIRDTGNEIILKPVSPFPVSQLEPPDTPSVYQGVPLTLEEMEKAIDIEAGKQK